MADPRQWLHCDLFHDVFPFDSSVFNDELNIKLPAYKVDTSDKITLEDFLLTGIPLVKPPWTFAEAKGKK